VGPAGFAACVPEGGTGDQAYMCPVGVFRLKSNWLQFYMIWIAIVTVVTLDVYLINIHFLNYKETHILLVKTPLLI